MHATSSLPKILTRWLLLCILIIAGSPFVRAIDPNDPAPPVVSLGNDTYSSPVAPRLSTRAAPKKLVQLARRDAERITVTTWGA